MTFEGACNRSLFEEWLKKMLLPQLKPNQILILDNATFHKGETIRQLVESAGCELLYLPPYSPDFNPHMFPIKIRRAHNEYKNNRVKIF